MVVAFVQKYRPGRASPGSQGSGFRRMCSTRCLAVRHECPQPHQGNTRDGGQNHTAWIAVVRLLAYCAPCCPVEAALVRLYRIPLTEIAQGRGLCIEKRRLSRRTATIRAS